MKIVITYFILFTVCLTVCGQTKTKQLNNPVKFDTIIEYFKKRNHLHDSTILPLVYQNKDYKIEISNNPIALDLIETVLKNPIDSTYPISYSVIYKDKLVSLFEPGIFICHSIPGLIRDTEFENKINTKKFQYHWILDNQLVGISNGKYYYLNQDNTWLDYNVAVPITRQPKLFEDSNYISYCDCRGEWGGNVYFYNKRTMKINSTGATCANSIIKKNSEYLVLSHLGHGFGFSKLIAISNPDQLGLNKIKTIFDSQNIQFFSSFLLQGRTIYLVHWKDITFLAELKEYTLQIINPLFNKELYTHRPVTTNYENTILMNLDFYGIAGNQEVSCIIIKNNQLIKFDWNEKHSH